MNIVNPDRLRVIRLARRMSQVKLAQASNVSARQIVRIEGAEGDVEVREFTVTRLAKALAVEPGVLSGVAPLPAGLSGGDEKMSRVMPAVLSELRRRRGWSRRQLAEAARVSVQLVEKAEKGPEPSQMRTHAVSRLAREFGVGETVLRGEDEVPPLTAMPPEAAMNLPASPALRLTYELVKRRYGADSKDLFVLAPLLFVLLAEGSLAWRRRKLAAAREASEALDALGCQHATLYFGRYQQAVEVGMAAEEKSINFADVLGSKVWNDDMAEFHGFSEDDTNITPFADYLQELADEIGLPEVVRFGGSLLFIDQGLHPWGTNPYEVCRGELEKVASQSPAAQAALEWGDVRLSEIPPGLREDEAVEKRVAWLESKLSEDARQRLEKHERLIASIRAHLGATEADDESE